LQPSTAATVGSSSTAQAAVDTPSVVLPDYYYPEDRGRHVANANCLHGEDEEFSGSTPTSQWTTGLCRTADPDIQGYTRFYNLKAGPNVWILRSGVSGDYSYMQSQTSQGSGYVVWFRRGASSGSLLEISVSLPNQTTLSPFEEVDYYVAQHYQSGIAQYNDLVNALNRVQWLSQQYYDVIGQQPGTMGGGSNSDPTTSIGEAQGQTNINRGNYPGVYGVDPIGTISGSLGRRAAGARCAPAAPTALML
jgi:hypothetical protein